MCKKNNISVPYHTSRLVWVFSCCSYCDLHALVQQHPLRGRCGRYVLLRVSTRITATATVSPVHPWHTRRLFVKSFPCSVCLVFGVRSFPPSLYVFLVFLPACSQPISRHSNKPLEC